ncbi:hypothetical protein F5Y15DRAFT_430080 [Xylariaceae sp. FL0016]|nr:hypothetical protein F5Y15DRAFT_430080 [Xylariaceae sp. FL0016]
MARQRRRLRSRGRLEKGSKPSDTWLRGNLPSKSAHGVDEVDRSEQKHENAQMREKAGLSTEDGRNLRPWETLAIGSLGENLSYIEEKDREIEQQRFIVSHHEKNSPHQVPHNRRILAQLIQERAEMEDSEENNMPEEQREEKHRTACRVESLKWALTTCQCVDEEINIRAALAGYDSGRIQYSRNFTLIYAGHIVDTCPTYQSFCVDRQERLARYYARHGRGWLWHEPPLAGAGHEALAKKAVCVDRRILPDDYGIGDYPILQKFTVDRDLVAAVKPVPAPSRDSGSPQYMKSAVARLLPIRDRERYSVLLESVLDSGATFPIIHITDLNRFNIDPATYPAQGIQHNLATANGIVNFRFFEMFVTVCGDGEGHSLVGEGTKAVWPENYPEIGGFFPVLVDDKLRRTPDGRLARVRYKDRLSGMVPFEACYISSAPAKKRIWLGEDRRDVLGAGRLPGQLRYDSFKRLELNIPDEFKRLQDDVQTPDRVVFLHELRDGSSGIFTDNDVQGTRGESELAIGLYRKTKDGGREAVRSSRMRVAPRREGGPAAHYVWKEEEEAPGVRGLLSA